MDVLSSPALRRLLARAEGDREVLAVILFGSHARGDASPRSDLDACLVLDPETPSRPNGSRKRLDYAAEAGLDLAIFQLLPLHLRSRVLKEGKVLFVRDEDRLYEVAVQTARAFEGFRHHHRRYLEAVASD
jgi:predicted nucleotidyltransferase